jgi:hypothetical protein
MRENRKQLLRAIGTALGAGALLITTMTVLGSARTAAPLRVPSVGNDPAIEAITVTGSANLPISDTRPHQALSRTVYFNNSALGETNGEITLAFRISDTSPLTLTAGAAFGDPEKNLTETAGALPWRPVVTYSVEPEPDSWPSVRYTVTNSNGQRSSVSITYTRDVTAPTVPTPTHPAEAAIVDTQPVTFTWEASEDDASGVLGYTVVVTGPDQIYSDAVRHLTSTESLDLKDNGVYTWRVQAVDAVENRSLFHDGITFTLDVETPPPSPVYLPLMARNYPPQPEGNMLIEGSDVKYVYQRQVTVKLTAVITDGVVQYFRVSNAELDLRNKGWQEVPTPTTDLDMTLPHTLEGGTSGLRTVFAQFKGRGGGTSEVVSDSVYLALNGNFELGAEQSAWNPVESPLPVTFEQSVEEQDDREPRPPADGKWMALLGNPDYPCASDGVPKDGYAGIEQVFEVPAGNLHPRLTFKYIIWSQDASIGEKYDRFEVRVNEEDVVFHDGNQVNDLSCDNWWPVPGEDNPRDGETSGWATAKIVETGEPIDLSEYAGQEVTISFRNYNRYDGWYNTYTYIDSIAIDGDWK